MTNRTFTRLAVALVAWIGVATAGYAGDREWEATKTEAAMLPQFCWGQMMRIQNGPPTYYIPNSCGVYTNHYCLGLLKLVRGNRTVGNLYYKKTYYRGAKAQTEEFLNAIKPYPQCPASFREHGERTLHEVDSLLKMLK